MILFVTTHWILSGALFILFLWCTLAILPAIETLIVWGEIAGPFRGFVLGMTTLFQGPIALAEYLSERHVQKKFRKYGPMAWLRDDF